jgi:MscS family membrane protein
MISKSIWSTAMYAVVFLGLLASGSFAQEQTDTLADTEQEAPEPTVPEDALGRGTPQHSARGFFAAAAERDFETAAEYLDLRNLPRGLDTEDGPRLARELNIVIERELFWIDIDALSNLPEGSSGDGLPTYRDELGRIETRDGEVVLLLQRVPRGDGEFIWKISNATVAYIPALYDEFGYGRIEAWLAETFPDVSFLGLELFKWVIVLTVGLLAYPLLLILMRGLSRLVSKPGMPLHDLVSRFFTRPVLWFLLLALLVWVVLNLGAGIEAQRIARARTVMTIVTVWMFLTAINLGRDYYSYRMKKRGQEGTEVLARPIANALKILVVVLAVLVWLDNAGFDITALLAGLGIGGLAIALALQKPLEDLFGAVSLLTHHQIKVGNFCRIGTMLGTVEEIGLRSSRIRTLDNTLVALPNARLANEYIDNFSARRKIWYHPKVRLRYESSPDQIRYVLVEIHKLLYSHPKVWPDGARIRFAGFGEFSLDLDVFSYIKTRDYAEYLEVAEDLNLRIMDIVAEAGTGFAFPTQTLQVERGRGLDTERSKKAEEQVQRWRQSEELHLPSFPQDKIDDLDGSLPYPPPGSGSEPR